MTYDQKVVLARVVAVLILALTLVQAGNADLLGITPRIGAWLAIAVGVLGGAAAYLPNVLGSDAQPEHIANRVMELSPEERLKLRAEIDRRHAAGEG
jgi:hypothetical protein